MHSGRRRWTARDAELAVHRLVARWYQASGSARQESIGMQARDASAGPVGYSTSTRRATAATMPRSADAIGAARRRYRSALAGGPSLPGLQYKGDRRPLPGAEPFRAARL